MPVSAQLGAAKCSAFTTWLPGYTDDTGLRSRTHDEDASLTCNLPSNRAMPAIEAWYMATQRSRQLPESHFWLWIAGFSESAVETVFLLPSRHGSARYDAEATEVKDQTAENRMDPNQPAEISDPGDIWRLRRFAKPHLGLPAESEKHGMVDRCRLMSCETLGFFSGTSCPKALPVGRRCYTGPSTADLGKNGTC